MLQSGAVSSRFSAYGWASEQATARPVVSVVPSLDDWQGGGTGAKDRTTATTAAVVSEIPTVVDRQSEGVRAKETITAAAKAARVQAARARIAARVEATYREQGAE